MIWKEVYTEGIAHIGPLGASALNLIVALGFVPLIVILILAVSDVGTRSLTRDEAISAVNGWLRSVNAILGCLVLLGIAVRAAGSVGGERDRDTMTSLLTTPLSARDILFGKLVGALVHVRPLVYWIAAAWAVGILATAVNPIALIAEPVVLLPPAAAAGAIGLYFSVTYRTTTKAIVAALVIMVFALGGHWALGCLCCWAPLALGGGYPLIGYLLATQAGATPPFALAMVPVALGEDWFAGSPVGGYLALAAVGLLLWIPVGIVVYRVALVRFALDTNRAGPIRPEPVP
jgi:ABC-type Na+ efflux pump permease subunit